MNAHRVSDLADIRATQIAATLVLLVCAHWALGIPISGYGLLLFAALVGYRGVLVLWHEWRRARRGE